MTTTLIVIGIYILIITLVQIGLIVKANYDGKKSKEIFDWNPSVSIILPCFDEETSIVSSISACIAQTYDNYDIIVVNDGSSDTSVEKLVNEFNLKIDKNDENIYSNPDLNLYVISKENGGKYSALNTGIEFSKADRILAVDADSLIVPHALETIVKYTNPESSASTTGIGMINGCDVDCGNIIKNKIPYSFFIASQVIEYLRTFIMLKMSLSKDNGIMVLSGACSFMDREFIQKIGGYKNRLTEDAEITLRIHRNGGTVQFISEVLSYTECPNNIKSLKTQRYRWIRGIIRDAWEHRSLVRNKNVLGRFMLPYFYITDMIFPWIELLGWILFVITIFTGVVSIPIVVAFLTFVISMYILNNFVLLYVANKRLKGFNEIENKWFLYLTSVVDYVYYRPIMVYLVITSQIKELFNFKSSWGILQRKGF